jgi:hypothetical protein
MTGMIPTPGELLQRLGADPAGAVAEELPHNARLSPGVWRIRAGRGQRAVLKYATAGRSTGETPWDAHWTARDTDPHRWTYWKREPPAYQSGLPAAYAGSGITTLASGGLPPGRRGAGPGAGPVPARARACRRCRG